MRILTTILFLATNMVLAQDIEDFTLPNVNSGSTVSLSEYSDKSAVLLIFSSNVCPYSIYYIERIRTLKETYGDKLGILLINSHKDMEESESAMKNKTSEWNLGIPYLSDKSQEIQHTLSVTKSPTAVILKPFKNGFSIYYRGMIDNNPQVESDVKDAYLNDNLNTLFANKPPRHPNNRTIGCMIR